MLRGSRPGRDGMQWLRRGAYTALGVGAFILSIVSVGVPGTAMLGSGWLLAAGLARRVPGLDGPVSWAAAVVIEVGVIVAESVALALLSPHEHGWRANLAVLLLPGLIGLALLLPWPPRLARPAGGWSSPSRRSTRVDAMVATGALDEGGQGDGAQGEGAQDEGAQGEGAPDGSAQDAHGEDAEVPGPGLPRTPARPLIALTVMVAGLIVPLWIASHGHNYRVAWVMSGDSRNHVQLLRSMLYNGGLNLHTLTSYPAAVDTVTAALSGAGGRGGLLPGRLLLHDLDAVVATYVLAGIALGLVVVAALLEMLPPVLARARRLPLGVTVLVVSSAGVGASALLLGTSVQDGFVSAYGSIPLAVTGVVLALRCCARPTPAAFALLGPAALLTFLGFTPLAVIPLLMVVVASAVALWLHRGALRRPELLRRARTGSGLAWLFATAVSWGSLLGCVGVTYTHSDTLRTQFLQVGTITGPNVHLVWLLGFLAVAVAACAAPGPTRRQALVPLGAAAASGAMLKFLLWLSPTGQAWTYYGLKSLYLFAGCLIWIAFVPALQALTSTATIRTGRVGGVLGTGQAVSCVLLIFLLLRFSTPLTSPLQRAAKGWNQPSAAVVTETAKVADTGQPFLLWGWTDGGNERLGNFWAALTWAYAPNWRTATSYAGAMNGGVPYWAYVEQASSKDICDAVTGVHGLDVVTHEKALKAGLDKACPGSGAHVIVESPGS